MLMKDRIERYKKDYKKAVSDGELVENRVKLWALRAEAAARNGDVRRVKLYVNACRRAATLMYRIQEAQLKSLRNA